MPAAIRIDVELTSIANTDDRPEAVGEDDDRFDDGGVFRIACEIADERQVDFQKIRG